MNKFWLLASILLLFLVCVGCTSSASQNSESAVFFVKNQRYVGEYDGKSNAVSLELELINNSNTSMCFNAYEFSGNYVTGIRVYEDNEFVKPNLADFFVPDNSSDHESYKVYLIPAGKKLTGWVSLHTMYEFHENKEYAFEYTLPIIMCRKLEQYQIDIPPSPTLYVEGVAEFELIDHSKEFTEKSFPDWAQFGSFLEMRRHELDK